LLCGFIPSAEEDDPPLTVSSAINPVPSAHVDAQFGHALAHGLGIAEIAGLDLPQSGSDPGLGYLVPQRGDPLDERRTSIVFLVLDELDHGNKCSIKATDLGADLQGRHKGAMRLA